MKAVVFLADGFEECEALIVVDILRRAGVETIMASVMGRLEVESSRHIIVKADELAKEVDYSSADLIFLPGGRLGTENLAKSELVKEKCLEFADDKMVAAICAAPTILAELGLMKRATVHPDFKYCMPGVDVENRKVVIDGNIVTGQGLGAVFQFAFTLVEELYGDSLITEKIKRSICYESF